MAETLSVHELAPFHRLSFEPRGPNHEIIITNVETAARSLGLKPLLFEVRRAEEFNSAFATMAARQAEAVFVVGDPMYRVRQARLTEPSLRYRLPTAHTNRHRSKPAD